MTLNDPGAHRLREFGESIFDTMSRRAAAAGAINLGQGAPDEDGPAAMLERAQEEIAKGNNQYSPANGVWELRQAIAIHQERFYDQDVDPESQVLVTVGASEALAATALGLLNPGDEVIVIEPFYDAYPGIIALAGATRVAVPLKEIPGENGSRGTWDLDADAVREAVTNKTAMVIINNPHNPTGAVFSHAELGKLAEVVKEHNLFVLSDEVYEHLTYDGVQHTPFATLPGMWNHTVTVSSAAKSFNATGWKTGWAVGPENLIRQAGRAKQFLSFAGNTPVQPAVAYALNYEMRWVDELNRTLDARRKKLIEALAECGLQPRDCFGTYFVLVEAPQEFADGMALNDYLTDKLGVTGIPVSAFADHPGVWDRYLRFGFCKSHDTLDEALVRLKNTSVS